MDSYIIPTGNEFLPDITKRRLMAMRSKEPDEQYKRHFDAAIMRKDGRTVSDIAEEIGVHNGTIMNWLHRMLEKRGLGEGYKTHRGIPSKFTPEILKELERDMKEPPGHHGLDSETWTSKVVAQHALNKFGISFTPPSMRRILTQTKTDWPGSAAAIKARKLEESGP